MGTVTEWLADRAPEDRDRVRDLTKLIHAAADVEEAVKWGRLTFTHGGDWHHWLCAVGVTGKGVDLMFHKGALLADPARLLRGEGKYLRQVPHDRAVAAPEEITALVREAIAHQHDMLDQRTPGPEGARMRDPRT